MTISMKILPDENGAFVITDGNQDFKGVIPEGMETVPKMAIEAFARGISQNAQGYIDPTDKSIPANRKIPLVEDFQQVNEVLIQTPE